MKVKTKSSPAKRRNLKTLYLLGLLLGIATALPTYIESDFINQFVSTTWISLFFAGANAIILLGILFYPKIIKKYGNYKIAHWLLIVNFLSLVLMAASGSALGIFLAFTLLLASFDLFWINMDILVEDSNSSDNVGQTRTIYYTFVNLGWVISQIIGPRLITNNNYRPIYLLAALFVIPCYIIFSRSARRFKDKVVYHKTNIKENLLKMWRNKNLRGIFFISMLLQIFYSLAIVYTPFYLHQSIGLSWSDLGIILAIALVPFVLFEIPAGIIADKKLGEKELLATGFTIMIASLVAITVTKSNNILTWILILFFSRIGAALVEAMRESYFFKNIDIKDMAIINFFRTTIPLGFLVSTLLGALIIAVFKEVIFVFPILAAIMLSSYYFLYKIKDTK